MLNCTQKDKQFSIDGKNKHCIKCARSCKQDSRAKVIQCRLYTPLTKPTGKTK